MKRHIDILVIIAIIVANSFAARADEYSDLVAIVAGSNVEKKIKGDFQSSGLDEGKPRYQPQNKTASNNEIALFDGVLKAMHRQQGTWQARQLTQERRPTLGREGFYRPVPGIITSNFGWRPQFHRMHHGVDLRLQIGDTVRAALTGTVNLVSYDHDGYGHYVVIRNDDGMETLYGHLEYSLVSQGQLIFAGQPVGIGGNTGNSTGPHLHFETRIGGIAVDPTLLFDFYGYYNYMAEASPIKSVPKDPVYSHQSKSLADESTYIVRYGDTLKSIARQAGISVMRLCQLNMLNQTDNPPIGRMLKLR